MAKIKPVKLKLSHGELEIYSIKPEEAGEVLKFMEAVTRETDYLIREPGELQLTEEAEKDYIKKQIKEERALFIGARVGNELVGTLGFSSPPFERYSHRGSFGMAVSRRYWNYGIGSHLVQALLKWAEEMGMEKISLEVDAENLRAIKLYRKFGFELEGILKQSKKMLSGEYRDELLMARILNERD